MRKRVARSIWLSAALVFLPSAAFGQAFTWTNAAGGNWTTAGNWSPVGGPPSAGDSAAFNLAGTYTVSLSAGIGNAADSASVTNGNVTWQSISTTLPGVLNLTTGSGNLTLSGTGQLVLGAVSRPVNVTASGTLSVQTGLYPYFGSSVTAGSVLVGTSTDGTIDVRDSTFSVTSTTTVGTNGNSGILSLRDSTGTFGGNLNIGVSGLADTFGSVELTTSDVTLQSVNIGTGAGGSGQFARLQVVNAADVAMVGASTLTVGTTSTAINSNLTVSGTGTIFSSGTGAVLFRNGSTFDVLSAGTVVFKGNTTFDAATAVISGNSSFRVDIGKTLTLQNGSSMTVTGATYNFDDGNAITLTGGSDFTTNASSMTIGSMIGTGNNVLVTGVGSDFTVGGSLIVGNTNALSNHSLTLTSGGDAIVGGNVEVRRLGTISVSNSSVMTISGDVTVTGGGNLTETGTGQISMVGTNRLFTVTNGGEATFVDLALANNIKLDVKSNGTLTTNTFSIGTTGSGASAAVSLLSQINVTSSTFVTGSGGDVSLTVRESSSFTSPSLTLFGAPGNLMDVKVLSGSTITATSSFSIQASSAAITPGDVSLTIDGVGSKVAGGTVTVGSANYEPIRVRIGSGATFDAASLLQILENSVVTVDGGTLEFNDLITNTGGVQFNSGAIVSTSTHLAVSNTSQLFGNYLNLDASKSVTTASFLLLDQSGTLELSGGKLTASTITNSGGQLLLDRGTLTLTSSAGVGPSAALGNSFRMKPDLVLNSPQLVNNGVVYGSGVINARLNNDLAGELRVDLLDTLRFNSPSTGHTNNGRIVLNGGRLDLNHTLDNGPAGDITGRGTLVSAGLNNAGDLALSSGISDVYGDVTNQSGGRIILSGNSDTTFWGDVTNNAGATLRVSAGSSATFFGTYSGGSITGGGTVYFEADVTPGFSPALVGIGGNVRFSEASRLVAEIDGPTRGMQYDALDIAGVATLTGALSYPLAPGYDPAYGLRHNILHASSLVGYFTPTPALQLSANKWVVVLYDADDVFLAAALPGDANVDGTVSFEDLLVLAQNYGQPSVQRWQTGDFIVDGIVNFNDLLLLAQRYGTSVLSEAQTATLSADFVADWALAQTLIPEPTWLGLVGLGGFAARRRSRSAGR